MDVTIIIPVFNRAGVVDATLASVAGQTMRPLRVVLVDNNSTDDSWQHLVDFKERCESDDFSVTVLKETTPGAAAARNCGLQAADTRWVMFFDSDDLMAPDLLESYAQVVAQNPDAQVVVTKINHQSAEGHVTTLPYFENDVFANHLLHCLLSTQRFVARREVLLGSGPWNASLRGWNDWELGVRILLQSPRLAFNGSRPRVTAIFSEESITGRDFGSRRGVWEQALDAVEADIAGSNHSEKHRLLRIVDYRRVVLAAHYSREGLGDVAKAMLCDVLAKYDNCLWRKMMLRFAYSYIGKGGRGFGRVIRAVF